MTSLFGLLRPKRVLPYSRQSMEVEANPIVDDKASEDRVPATTKDETFEMESDPDFEIVGSLSAL